MTVVLSDEAAEATAPAQFMDHHSPSLSTVNSRRSAAASDVADAPDRAFLDRSSSLSSSSRLSDSQSLLSLRSEEYRQLFRLPADEVLIQDFNCALQENFLLQGHMYLFVHSICFYSNLFGFETKEIIPFHEITSVRRAKVAAIFPTAIEIIAGGKKFFFTSFLSRDEAFKLINDGWLQHNNGPKVTGDQQEPYSEPISQENGCLLADKTESSDQPVDEAVSVERYKEVSLSDDTKPLDNGDYEVVPNPPGPPDNLEEGAETVQSTDCSSSGKSLVLEEVDYDAPQVPESYTMIAESKFPVNVEKFFDLFFSDDGVDFQESFHKNCGDKDFKCTPWHPHEKFGHTRNVSFQHPIDDIYFGVRFGSCQELVKYRVYRNCHLVVETSQEISDAPYGDYFQVEGLWDVMRDGSEGCILKVYTNVAFSKKTMCKGKIVQSTIEECRYAYATWIELAHEFLKQRKPEKEQGSAMDGVNASHRQSFDYAALIDMDPIPPFIHRHFRMVYFSIFFATLCTIGGACLHFAAEIGGWFPSLGFLGSVICFVMASQLREVYFSLIFNTLCTIGGMCLPLATGIRSWYISLGFLGSVMICFVMTPLLTEVERFSFLMVGAFLLGASVFPWIQPFLNIDPRVFIASLVGRALCFGTFWVGAKVAPDRSHLYIIGLLLSYPLLLIWSVVVLRFFDNVADVAMVFLESGLFPLLLLVYSQEMAVKARAGEVDVVESAIRFFTDFIVVTIYSLVLVVGRVFGEL